MSISIPGIGTSQPFFTPPNAATAPPPPAPSVEAGASASKTTLGVEAGAAAVVYQPGKPENDQSHIYANPERANRYAPESARSDATPVSDEAARRAVPARPQEAAAAFSSTGDQAVVAATGGAAPPPSRPEAPLNVDVAKLAREVRTPSGPTAPPADPATTVGGTSPQQPGQAEASAQASYAAVADAMIMGASIADLPKYA